MAAPVFRIAVSFVVFLLSTQKVTTRCSEPWYISLSKEITLSWTGEERNGTVFADVTTEDDYGRDCDAKRSLVAKFSDGIIVVNNTCSNALYFVAVRLFCDGITLQQNLTMRTPPDAPTNIIFVPTDTTIMVKWSPPAGRIQLYRVICRRNESRDRMQDREQETSQIFWTFDGLTPDTEYYLTVSAKNDEHWSEASPEVSVRTMDGVPSSPQNLRVVNKSSDFIEITWDVPDPPYGAILGYQVRVMIGDEDSGIHGTTATSFVVENLEPYVKCFFKVRAETKAGWGRWSTWLTVRTDVGFPSEPLNLTVISTTSESIEIEWVAPERPHAPYLSYLIRWTEVEDSQVEETEVNVTTTYHIRHLEAYTQYTIRVCAKTTAGTGPDTEPLVVRTKAGVPSSPREMKAVDVQATEITIEWTAPERIGGPLERYELRWGVEGTHGSVFWTIVDSYRALGLRPYTQYFFEVSASTESGMGPPTYLYQKTDIFAPSVPLRLRVVSVSDHCVALEWCPPENPNAPFVQYSVEWSRADARDVEQSYDSNATAHTICFLDSFTNYSVRVRPQNAAGKGPATERLYVRTKAKDRSSVIISSSVVGGLVLVLSIGVSALFYFLRKKRNEEQQREPTEMSTTCFPLEPIQDWKKVSVESFEEHVAELMSNNCYELAQEFKLLGRQSPAFSTDVGKQSDHLSKNRWLKILPFDHCRVKLLPVGDEVEPDYINASYVPGESYLLEYIATQGPLPTTLDDFWKMVWQESVFLIVMLTQCVERAKRTCELYWPPPGTSARYGSVEVMAVSENIGPCFTQKLLRVSQGSKQRHVVHLHYTNWPVSGCPKSSDDFLTFVQTVRSQAGCAATSGPLLVHCSAGIGRTGTFIAIDRLSQQLSKNCKELDVYGTVLDMRKYRHNLVQTEAQYYFIYLCVKRLIQRKRLEEGEYGGTN